jgi:hypothetical protein
MNKKFFYLAKNSLEKQLLKNKLFTNNYFLFSGKIIPLILPDLGEGTKEAQILKWYKNEGDSIDEVFKQDIFNIY